jgi:2-C-methyl-D-erythritol 4-phosphate cytidylyltransferase
MSEKQIPRSAQDDTPADVGVVIVAGGSGTRVGGRELKQFRWVGRKPMLLHSLQTFMARADVVSVVCVLPSSHASDPPPWIFQCDVDRLMIAPGGKTRRESVSNGLDDLPDEAKVVLVHDAARPGVTDAMISRVVAAARRDGAAIAGLPSADTLKSVAENGSITGTVDRAGLWRAQTPQGFHREIIVRAHREARKSGIDATDDAALCERLGIPVTIVRGDERAMKVTEEEDFARAAALLRIADEG